MGGGAVRGGQGVPGEPEVARTLACTARSELTLTLTLTLTLPRKARKRHNKEAAELEILSTKLNELLDKLKVSASPR
jgi:hypothetical protein